MVACMFLSIFQFRNLIIGLTLIVVLAVVTACSTSNSDTKNSSKPRLSFASVTNPWLGANPKYKQLASGPLGSKLGAELSAAAMRQAIIAEYDALETGRSGETTRWQYSSAQNGKIISYPPYQVGSANCRRYIHSVSINGKTSQAAGTACRNKDGIWTPLT